MIGEADVRYVAKLARLRLEHDEIERITGELAKILGHIDQMGKLNLSEVPPTANVLDLVNVRRADKSRPSLPRSEALKNAPAVADESFRVPRMS